MDAIEREERELTEGVQRPQPQRRPWENIILVIVICLTLFLLTSGWDVFDNWNRAMYTSLAAALIMMYAQRRAESSGKVPIKYQKWLARGVFVAISISIALFCCVLYIQHFA